MDAGAEGVDEDFGLLLVGVVASGAAGEAFEEGVVDLEFGTLVPGGGDEDELAVGFDALGAGEGVDFEEVLAALVKGDFDFEGGAATGDGLFVEGGGAVLKGDAAFEVEFTLGEFSGDADGDLGLLAGAVGGLAPSGRT